MHSSDGDVDDRSHSQSDSLVLSGTCDEWKVNIQRVLFSAGDISHRVQSLAAEISHHYREIGLSGTGAGTGTGTGTGTAVPPSVLCVGLLSGAFIFLSDLVRSLTVPYQVDFMVLSSYSSGTQTSGTVKLKKDLSINPAHRHVLIIEDLIDTGTTLAWLKQHLATKQCLSITLCCLLNKKARRVTEVKIDYVGFDCPDEFVIGYGMDYNDNYRCLPYIGVLRPEAYQ